MDWLGLRFTNDCLTGKKDVHHFPLVGLFSVVLENYQFIIAILLQCQFIPWMKALSFQQYCMS